VLRGARKSDQLSIRDDPNLAVAAPLATAISMAISILITA